MKQLLYLRESHYPLKTRPLIAILSVLFFLCNVRSQDLLLTINDPVGAVFCQSAATELNAKNISGGPLSNIHVKVILPAGMEYIPGTVSGAIEVNINTPSTPEFNIPSILNGATAIVKIEIIGNCHLHDQFNMGAKFFNKWIVQSGNNVDSISSSQAYKIETPLLIIGNVSNIKAVTGAKLQRTITITNTRLGSLKNFQYEDRHDSLNITSSNGSILSLSQNVLHLEFDADDFLNIGDRDSLFEMNESITIVEDIEHTSCKLQTIRSFFFAHWGCLMDTCQIDTVTSSIEFVQTDERALLTFSSDQDFPICICSDTGTTQCLTVTNEGNRTAENIIIDLWSDTLDVSPYGILRGSISAPGATILVDTLFPTTISPDSCKTHEGFIRVRVLLHDLAPGEEVKITFRYMTCLPCAAQSDLYWYYFYSYNSKCVDNSLVKNIRQRTVEMKNSQDIVTSRNNIKDAAGLIEDKNTYVVQNYILLPVKRTNQYLILQYKLPCPLRLIDSDFILDGKKPIYKSVEEVDSSINIFLVYDPPTKDSLYQEYSFYVDCNYLCIDLARARSTLFISSCPNQQLLLTRLVGAICIKAKLSCPEREYDCGPCSANATKYVLRCSELPANRDSIFSYLEGDAFAYRKNYGGPDPDNNRFLDPGTLDTNQTQHKTFITGDTLVNDFRTAVVINDDRFYFDSVMFMVTPNPLMFLNPIYSIIEIKDSSSGNIYSCVYPVWEPYQVNDQLPNCDSTVIARFDYGDGFIVPFNPELLNKYGAQLPPGFKFEKGDSINAKVIGRILNIIGDKVLNINLTYRAFFIDRNNIRPDPFSCMAVEDTIKQATLRVHFNQNKNVVYICKTGFDLFNATINGSKELDNLFTREFRDMFSLDTVRIFIQNPDIIVDGVRLDFFMKTPTGNQLIAKRDYPVRKNSSNTYWEIDPLLLKENRFDEAYTIQVTPYAHLLDCAKFKTSSSTVISSFHINGNNGCLMIGDNTANFAVEKLLYSKAFTVQLFNGNDSFNIPDRVITPTLNGVTWPFFITKLLLDGSFELRILSKNNSLYNMKLVSDSATQINKLDSNFFEIKKLDQFKHYLFNFSADFKSCETDTVMVLSRWICDIDSSTIRDECNIDTFILVILGDKPELELYVDTTGQFKEVALCDTLPEINLEIYNADKGRAFEVYCDVFIPPGTEIIPGSMFYSYPKGSPFVPLPPPDSLGMNGYRWNFEDFIPLIKQDGLREYGDTNSLNSIQLKMKLITRCNATVNSYSRFFISGKNHCGKPTNSKEQTGNLIKIKGLSAPSTFQLKLENPDLKACTDETTLKITILKSALGAHSDSLKVILPGGIHYKPNSLISIKNFDLQEPVIVMEQGNEALYFKLQTNVLKGDSIVFTLIVNNLKNIICTEQHIMAFTYTRSKTKCSITNENCDVFLESGSAEIKINLETGSFNLDSFNISRNKDSLNYNLNFNYQLKDIGLFFDSIICIGLYEDLNSNQKLEGTDPLVDTFCIDLKKITADGTYHFENFIEKSKLVSCNYLLTSLPSNCICNLDTLAVNLNFTQGYSFKDSLCIGSTINLGIKSDSTKKYKWIEGSVPCDTCSSVFVTIHSTGGRDTLLNYTLHEIDKNGCTTKYKYQIKITKPDAGVDKLVNCTPLPGGTAIMSATGKGTWTTLTGNPGTAIINTPTLARTAITSFTAEGIYNFIWTDDTGCKDTVSVLVTSKPDAGSDKIICTVLPGGSVTLSASGSGSWSTSNANPGTSTITNPNSANTMITSFSNEGTYQFIWMNASGCFDTVNVIVNPNPQGNDTLIETCPDEFISINAGTRIKYSWMGDSITNPLNYEQIIKNDKDKTIYLSFKDVNDCASIDTFHFHPLIDTTKIFLFRDSMFVPSGDTSIVKNGGSIIYCIIGGKVVRWEPDKALDCNDCPCVKITPDENTSYTVTAVDSFNCPKVFQFTVLLTPINCDTSNVFIPNAFSPNNDTKNDILFVRCQYLDDKKEIPVINKMHLGIYNRWGEKVFESFSIKDGWDGTFKGELLPPDVYGYFLEAECIGGKKYFKKGNISLLK